MGDLPLGQGNGAVDTVGLQVLDKSVLEAAILLKLGHVAKRGGVALGPQESLRAGTVGEQESEAVVDLGFKQIPGGRTPDSWGRVWGRRGRRGDLVERRVVGETRGAFVQYGHRVRRVHLNAGEVRASGDGTPH